MTISSTIGGQRVVVPGVYSVVSVENNLASVTPGARNVLIIGEASKGAPGNLLDLSGVFFQDFESLKAYYGTGPVVDAAYNIFQNQASPVFSGTIGSLYVYKTNNASLATANLPLGLAAYGILNAAEFGEEGNLISSQVQNAATEIKPTTSFSFLNTITSTQVALRISGNAAQTTTIAAEGTAADLVTAINGFTGVTATGGANLEILSAQQVIDGDTLSLSIGSDPSTVVITCSVPFAGANYASIVAGSAIYIPAASELAGPGAENVGNYLVTSKTSTTITMTKLTSTNGTAETGHILPVAVLAQALSGSQSAVATAELIAFTPVTVTVTETTDSGQSAALEIYSGNGVINLAGRMLPATSSTPVSSTIAAVASVSLSVSGGLGTFAIQSGSFASTPKAGDIIVVKSGSPLAGTNDANVGQWIVTSAGSVSISATKLNSNIVAPVAVASTLLNGETQPFLVNAGFVSTSVAAKTINSAAERQVRFAISRQSDGKVFPNTAVGGRVVLELSYNGTTALLSITKLGRLQTTVTGGTGANLDIPLNKYATMGDLVGFINAKTGYKARVPNPQLASLSPRTVLDQVTDVGICAGHDVASYAGHIKSDYADVSKLFADNFGLVAFQANTALPAYVGLPDAQSTPVFLTGGTTGSTSNASILEALDAALKIEVTQVVPLFSRDASEDVLDGLTEPASSYSIESINLALRSHVATASTVDYRKERFGVASFHASFEDTKNAVATWSSERMQTTFQMVRAVAADGNSVWFAPWMAACMIAAGRVQSALGTSMLRKSFNMSEIKHLGATSIYSDSLVIDFDPDTKELDQAIEAGLLVFKAVTGFGIRLESPDLSTRSRENDPKAWFYERISVQFVLDEVLKTSRATLDNFIGNRFSDVSSSVIRKSLGDVLSLFVAGGALRGFSIDKITQTGTTYACTLSVKPTEAVEFITLDVLAQRDQTA